MSDDLSIPAASEALVDAKQLPSASWYRVFSQLVAAFNDATRGLTATDATVDGKASVTQIVCASFTFKFPEAETVALILNSKFAWTITQTDVITEVGTATVTTKIGAAALDGSANAASTSLNTVTHAASNAVALTNQINVTFSSVSPDCENLCLTVWGTRTLDA